MAKFEQFKARKLREIEKLKASLDLAKNQQSVTRKVNLINQKLKQIKSMKEAGRGMGAGIMLDDNERFKYER